MTPLVEKYRPRTINDFAGLDRPRAVLSQLAVQPYCSSWLFLGPSGIGKTTMALAFSGQIGAELHHIPSRKCDLQTVEEVVRSCWYVPMTGQWHVVLVDEADQMSSPAQLAFLSKLDATAAPPNTIFIFTANATDHLEDRFLSRCRTVRFQPCDIAKPAVELLETIWMSETARPQRDFQGILQRAQWNIRQAIMDLELEILAPSRPRELQPMNAFMPPSQRALLRDRGEA